MMASLLTQQLLERLQRHYLRPGEALPGGVFVPECGWNGGGTLSRCDALYVGFTASSGRLLIGHELKVSRGDWRAELAKPGKADPWHDQCHAWYVVAPSTQVVPVDELPDGWGLMVPSRRSATRFTTVKPAAVDHNRTPSWDAVRSLMARQDTLRAETIGQIRRDAVTQARQELRDEQERLRRAGVITEVDPDTRRRLEALGRLEALLGVGVTAWVDGEDVLQPETAARLLQIVRDEQALLGIGPSQARLLDIERSARDLAGAIDRYRDALGELQRSTDPRSRASSRSDSGSDSACEAG